MIKAILFDLDDTLLDQKEASTAALRQFHAAHCTDMEWEQVKEKWDHCLQTHFSRYVRGEITFQEQRRCRIRDILGNPDLEDAVADRLLSTFLSAYEEAYSLFPDVRPFLENTRGFRFGVITNGAVQQQKDKLIRMGIHSHFGAVLISEEAGLRKPDPEIFRRAAGILDVLPAECLFIGDNFEADYVGSREAGMHPVLIQRHEPKKNQDIRAISSFTELPSLIESLI